MTPQELIKNCENESGSMSLVIPRERAPTGRRVRMAYPGSPLGDIALIRQNDERKGYLVVAWFDCKDVAKWMLKEAPLNDSERERLERVVS